MRYKQIFLGLTFLVMGACASTSASNSPIAKNKISEIHVMNDFDLCYAFFTLKNEDDWFAHENIRRVRRLDCERYREQAQAQFKGKRINYDALNVTKLFRRSERNDQERRPILEDKTLNEVCYVKIDELVFAKRGPASACAVSVN
jgi:hypothetical protein